MGESVRELQPGDAVRYVKEPDVIMHVAGWPFEHGGETCVLCKFGRRKRSAVYAVKVLELAEDAGNKKERR